MRREVQYLRTGKHIQENIRYTAGKHNHILTQETAVIIKHTEILGISQNDLGIFHKYKPKKTTSESYNLSLQQY